MFCDLFRKHNLINLLSKKKIWFIGDSNMRAIYKDLLWLSVKGDLATQEAFRSKNEEKYLTDKRLSNGTIHNGVNYVETRESTQPFHMKFHFLTRLYLDTFVKMIESTEDKDYPDIIFMNSTLWDLTRWGSTEDCIQKFKENLVKTFKLLTNKFPDAKIIWKTCLPLSRSATGAIFIDEIKCVVPMLPWHIIEANRYASVTAAFFNIDTLDLHHHMRMHGYLRVKDGIHWDTVAVRYMTNVFLTHISICLDIKLPGHYLPSKAFLAETSSTKLNKKLLDERLEKKKGFITKLFNKAKEVKKTIKKAKNMFNKNKNFIHKVKNTFKGKSKNLTHRNNLENDRNVQYRNVYPNRQPLNPNFITNNYQHNGGPHNQPSNYMPNNNYFNRSQQNNFNYNFTITNNYYNNQLPHHSNFNQHNDSQVRMVYSHMQQNHRHRYDNYRF